MKVNEKNAKTLLWRADIMRTTAKTMQQYSEEGGNQKVTALESALSKFLVKVADEIESCFTEV